ncbi:hypothetical protein K435DRAFT_804193 [Dendrothele bispora CBS 962.96]|uniref:Uncharacterized protein n=1 Tax=Dendrothele bispora (strain CBS 962.96) TaxID=1314807 RepID=A0A4S8LF22_DENBC|nr:hypothetical protein K435DRAFT_804193 [Dendrothele bispora CBS 962.96]
MASVLKLYKNRAVASRGGYEATTDSTCQSENRTAGQHRHDITYQMGLPTTSQPTDDLAALICRPMFTPCATAAFLFGAGDVIAQQGVEKKGLGSRWEPKPHFYSFFVFVFERCFFGPAMTKWYQFLNKIKFASPTRATIYRAYVPPATLIRNWGVFVPTQIINFSIVPHHLRFVVVSVVSLFWNTYLSIANARTQHEQESLETAAESEVMKEIKEIKDAVIGEVKG